MLTNVKITDTIKCQSSPLQNIVEKYCLMEYNCSFYSIHIYKIPIIIKLKIMFYLQQVYYCFIYRKLQFLERATAYFCLCMLYAEAKINYRKSLLLGINSVICGTTFTFTCIKIYTIRDCSLQVEYNLVCHYQSSFTACFSAVKMSY